MNLNFIFSAWPYPNGELHLGRIAGSILPADIFYRYNQKFKKSDTFIYTFGSDGHGTPIILQAQKLKKTEEEIVEEFHFKFINTLSYMNIHPDLYNHTHTNYHFLKVSEFLKKINHNKIGDKYGIYYKTIELFFCDVCKIELDSRFTDYFCKCGNITDREQCEKCMNETNPSTVFHAICKKCNYKAIVIKKELEVLNILEHKNIILDYIKTNYTKFYDLATKYFEQKNCDKELTRSLKWGVPSPFINKGVIYVWFDALLGYLANANLFTNNLDFDDYYFIGLDNWLFHLIILSALKLSLGLKLPKKIFIKNYLNFKNEKMSSSKQNFILAENLKVPTDAIRWYLCKIDPFNSDANFSEIDLKTTYNTELINTIINFQHRIFGLLRKIKIEEFTLSQIEQIEELNLAFEESNLKKIVYEIIIQYKKLNLQLQNNEFINNYRDILNRNFSLLHYLEPIIPETAIKFIQLYTSKQIFSNEILNLINQSYRFNHLI